MGLLDGIMGGAIGAAMVTAVNSLIEKHGGLKGLVNDLEQKGLGPAVQSWIGTEETSQLHPNKSTKHLVGYIKGARCEDRDVSRRTCR